MMGMINEAKEGIKITLRNNDASREEERVCMADKTVILSSDDNSDSETIEISSKPATSSNKSFVPCLFDFTLTKIFMKNLQK